KGTGPWWRRPRCEWWRGFAGRWSARQASLLASLPQVVVRVVARLVLGLGRHGDEARGALSRDSHPRLGEQLPCLGGKQPRGEALRQGPAEVPQAGLRGLPQRDEVDVPVRQVPHVVIRAEHVLVDDVDENRPDEVFHERALDLRARRRGISPGASRGLPAVAL